MGPTTAVHGGARRCPGASGLDSRWRRLARCLVLAGLIVPWLDVSAEAQRERSGAEVAGPQLDRFADNWLRDVTPIATVREREAFVALENTAEQELFISRFWAARSPGQTQRFVANLRTARELRSRSVERTQVAILAGAPVSIRTYEGCDLLRPLEVWRLFPETVGGEEPVAVFVRRSAFDPRTATLWTSGDGRELLFGDRFSSNGSLDSAVLVDHLARERCLGSAVLSSLRRALEQPVGWQDLYEVYRWAPSQLDWLSEFADAARSARAPRDAVLSLESVGRYSRSTIVRGLVKVGLEDVHQPTPGQVLDEFTILGDIRRGRRTVDSFRIVHRLAGTLPVRGPVSLDFHRRLFPGNYTLSLRVADRAGVALLREQRDFEVLNASEKAPPPPGRRRSYGSLTREEVVLFTSLPSVEILPPPPRLLGREIDVRAVTAGAAVNAVEFVVDGERSALVRQPPFSVRLDLDAAHVVEARALDVHGQRLASDRRRFEPGPVSFAVSIVNEDVDGRSPVRVALPKGASLGTFSCFHNRTRVSSLSAEEIDLSRLACSRPQPGPGLVYLRAEARLASGEAVEDLVFISGSPEAIDVSLAELFVSVADREGRPLADLTLADLSVSVDGRRVAVERFTKVDALPLAVAVMIDTSSSMSRSVGRAADRTRTFFERLLRDQDEASLLAFNHDVRRLSDFGAPREVLYRAPFGLRSWGSTRLFDAVAFGLHGFAGSFGRRALIVISDGTDTESDLGLIEVSALARQAGVMIYPVLLAREPGADPGELPLLAERTGGRFFRAVGTGDLDRVFRQIESLLRLQYSLVVQANSSELQSLAVDAGPGRSVRVQGYTP